MNFVFSDRISLSCYYLRIKVFYENEVVPKLVETFNYKNKMEVPKLDKIVLNMGLGEATHNIKILDAAVEELKMIAGQKTKEARIKARLHR